MSLLTYDKPNEIRWLACITLAVIAFINIIAPITLIILMKYMNKYNLLKMNIYMYMVVNMSFCQVLLNSSWFIDLSTTNMPSSLEKFYRFFVGVNGVSVSLWSFFIILIVYLSSSQTNVGPESMLHPLNMNNGNLLKILFVINAVLSTSVGVFMGYLLNYDVAWSVFGIIRLVLAGISLIALLILVRKLYQQTAPGNRRENPLYSLLWKLALYPVGSIIFRLGSIPNDMIYHLSLAEFPQNAEPIHVFVLFSFVILTPSQGIWDLIVFCMMSNGSSALYEMLCVCPTEGERTSSLKHINHENRINSISTRSDIRRTCYDEEMDRHASTTSNMDTEFRASLSRGFSIGRALESVRDTIDDSYYDYTYTETPEEHQKRINCMVEDELLHEIRREYIVSRRSSIATVNTTRSSVKTSISFVHNASRIETTAVVVNPVNDSL